MTDTTTAVEPFTDRHEKTLRTLQGIQKANFGRMESARRSIESTEVKIRELLDHKWAAMLPRDYLAEDDYEGFVTLMRVQGSDEAHRYRHDYILSLDPHFHYEDTEKDTWMPIIRLEVPHDDTDEALTALGSRMEEWAKFRARHEAEKISDTETPDQDHATMFKVFDYDLSQYGTHWLRVFPDATAQRVASSWDQMLALDTERRPLFDVLQQVRERWYYPAESNPEHTPTSSLFGWTNRRDTEESEDND